MDELVAAAEYAKGDVVGTLHAIGPWWDELVARLDPAPVLDLAAAQADLLDRAMGRARPAEVDLFLYLSAATDRLSHRFASGDLDRAVADDLLDRSMALLQRAGRALARAGAFTHATGAVHGLYRSGGGVPKVPVDEVEIRTRGVVGDQQRTRRHHGRPWQALCLWSKEKVDLLAAEGHPITYGAAGENISVTGIDWALVRPGTRMLVGADVLAEISLYALPCAQNAAWFADRDFTRMHHEREVGISRIYASVLRGGTVRPGDPVVLEPADRQRRRGLA